VQRKKTMAFQIYEGILDIKDLRIGIVQARFNEDICCGLASACLSELYRVGIQTRDVLHITVPGALEIPLALQKMANSTRFDALIAIGSIIRGDTYHFEIVSNESSAGITRISLDTDTPIANAILTTDNSEQARVRIKKKGIDAAQVAIEMANLSIMLKNTGKG